MSERKINTRVMNRVRKIIETQPGRHDQAAYLSNALDPFWTGAYVQDMKGYGLLPIPAMAEDPDNPVCGTTGCVAGWTVMVTAPKGTRLTTSGNVWLPRAEFSVFAATYAQEKLGLTGPQARYTFSSARTRDEVLAALAYLPKHPDATMVDLVRECGDERDEYGGDAAYYDEQYTVSRG